MHGEVSPIVHPATSACQARWLPTLPAGFASTLSALRTDLDRFLPEEAALLMYHGYWATHVRLLHLRPDLATVSPRWRDFANLGTQEQTRLWGVLSDGARRSFDRR